MGRGRRDCRALAPVSPEGDDRPGPGAGPAEAVAGDEPGRGSGRCA